MRKVQLGTSTTVRSNRMGPSNVGAPMIRDNPLPLPASLYLSAWAAHILAAYAQTTPSDAGEVTTTGSRAHHRRNSSFSPPAAPTPAPCKPKASHPAGAAMNLANLLHLAADSLLSAREASTPAACVKVASSNVGATTTISSPHHAENDSGRSGPVLATPVVLRQTQQSPAGALTPTARLHETLKGPSNQLPAEIATSAP